ncbi:winged helix-turn-helix domain-containing protein [Bradyrhizobium yuanmingense]|uniref:ATP-binding protein n=1 Tax=Bradyrhizobium yuanmingense TaxID=108015 RepID=UPI0023B8C39E|nr:winged helix-turn-helix domain-containing protein [Bradyrhizobium yuanmingense]MDF0516197.1 winged helix-turn-helix domain-containing protein [Bradyrhizobium yuanmingense]
MANRGGPGPSIAAEGIPEAFSFGPFCVFPNARRLERDGTRTQLGGRAFDILCILISRQGEVVSKAELMEKAWSGLTVEDSSLRFHIAQLRRVLGDGEGGESYVTNVAGRGYCFVAPVNRTASPAKRADSVDETPHPNLPPRPTRIIGREQDVLAVADHLVGRRFVTLRGPGGIGKTTLAIDLAYRMAARFPDGARFLDLGSLKEPNLVAIAVASALGLLIPVGDPTPRLIESLRDQQMLLVLDSCEHVIEAVSHLAEQIYGHAPGVSLLATSRESLDAEGESVFELASLGLPPDNVASEVELGKYSSTRLFMECAVAAGYSADITDTDAEIIGRICRKLDGMPLAIELVASRLSAHGLLEIDELIGGRLRLAWRGRRTALPRHQSLSAALDWSYELIAPEERTLLEYLSIFPGPFTLQGARALAGDLDDPDAVPIRLEQLVTKSLVASSPRSAQTSFRLLETTRAYAIEKLAASGASSAAALKHASYVLQALKPRSYEPGGERPGGWAHRGDLLSDARAALVWVYSDAGDTDLRIPLAAACARLFVERNLLEECRLWAMRALALPENAPGDRTARVELLWAFGHAAMFTERNSQECEAALRRGLALAQEVGDLENQFRLLSRLHALYRRTYERRKLLEVAQLADAVATEIGHPAALARAHTYLGVARHLSGDQRLARERLQAGEAGDAAIPALPVDHFASPRGTHIMSCTNLWLLGLPDQAVSVANGLMDIGSNPDLAMYCAGLCFAARVYRWVGDTNALEEAAARLADHARKHGFGPFYNVSLALKGELQVTTGAVDEGIELLQQSLPRMIADRLELYSGAAAVALVEGLAIRQRLDDALDAIQTEIKSVADQGDSWEMPELLRVRGELRARSGDRSGAEQDFGVAMALAEQQSALSWSLRIAASRLRLATEPKARAAAVSDLKRIYARFGEGFDTADLRHVREILQQF